MVEGAGAAEAATLAATTDGTGAGLGGKRILARRKAAMEAISSIFLMVR